MLYTIGYEGSSLADFVATLRLAEVRVVADIRDRAQSRRPGFSKSALSAALQEAGIEYIHLKELGDPKAGRDAARRGDIVEFRRVFSKVMSSKEAAGALGTIANLIQDATVCLMCYERDEKTCHRKIVSEDLEMKTGTAVKHLGVVHGVGVGTSIRRMHDPHQSAAASL